MTSSVPDDDIAFRGQWTFDPNLLPEFTANFHRSTNVGDKATLLFNGSSPILFRQEGIGTGRAAVPWVRWGD